MQPSDTSFSHIRSTLIVAVELMEPEEIASLGVV